MDFCDNCGCRMKHDRLNDRELFVCGECRDWGMKQLGKTHTALHVGIAAEVEEIPGCVWKHADTPFASNH